MEGQRLKAEFACEMSCNACKTKIETTLAPLEGVRIIDIDVPSQRVMLELSPASQTVNELQTLIEEKTGIKTVVKGLGGEIAAVAEIHGNDNVVGVVRLAQLLGNTCVVDGVIDGLFRFKEVSNQQQQQKSLSLNIHKFGDLSDKSLKSIGPVFIPLAKRLNETSSNRSAFKMEIANCDLSTCIGRSMAVTDVLADKVLGAGIVARASPVGENVKQICACSGKTLWEEREIQQQLENDENIVLTFSEENFVARALANDSLFDSLLKEQWIAALSKNVFRYTVTEGSIESKVIHGKYNFVAEFNANRGLLRRKPQNSVALRMPFNANGFNFTKVSPDEHLFQFRLEKSSNDVTSILINNSPVEFCSSLMVPTLDKCLPQVLTQDSISVAVSLVALSGHKSFRMGFNSLGAAASVNQLHWHLYYLDFDLAIETTPVEGNLLKEWPTPGFAFEVTSFTIDDIEEVSRKVYKIVEHCFEIELPHNLFITRNGDGAIRVILWPREAEFGTKNDMDIAAAMCEFSGFFICKTKEQFDHITEKFCVDLMASLDTKMDYLSKIFPQQ